MIGAGFPSTLTEPTVEVLMSVRPHHRRVPRARIDPITDAGGALPLVLGSLRHPPEFETLVLVLDDAHRGVGVVSVSGTSQPDHAVEVVEYLSRPELFHGEAAAMIVASARPGGGTVDGDVDRWFEMCDLTDAAGIELVEWFVIGQTVSCPRDLVGVPPRWRDVRPA